LPRLIESLCGGNVSAASGTYGALAALYSLMQFLFAPVLGSLSDRFGRRTVILNSLLGSGLDYLLLAFAPTLPWFFLGRMIAGITGANITATSAYRYHWTSGQVGVSLAIVGAMAAIVQGVLARRIIPALGERRSIVVGLRNATIITCAYGLATQGWMIYVILTIGSFGAIAMPAIQGLISRGVPLNEQGAVQGALASVGSLAGILGPPLATSLFAYFISPRAPIHVPGMAFFSGSFLFFCSLLLALRSFRKTEGATAPARPSALPQ
jgi:MFS family permease